MKSVISLFVAKSIALNVFVVKQGDPGFNVTVGKVSTKASLFGMSNVPD